MKKEDVLELLREFNKSSCNIFTLELDELKLHLEKPAAQTPAVQVPIVPTGLPIADDAEKSDNFFVEAPLIASFYRAPAPGEEPYIQVGDFVTKGQVLFVLEAMKMINEIKSPVSGKVVAILPKDGELVEYGERIVEIEVDHV